VRIIIRPTDLNDLTKFEEQITKIGTTVTTDLKGCQSDIMHFHFNTLNITLGAHLYKDVLWFLCGTVKTGRL